MTYHPRGKDPYQDKHEKGYNEPYEPGETEQWLEDHLADQAEKDADK